MLRNRLKTDRQVARPAPAHSEFAAAKNRGEKKFDAIMDALSSEYAVEKDDIGIGLYNMFRLLGILDKPAEIVGKRVLDLGCGAILNHDTLSYTRRSFEPWACRALHAAGADVVGVDIQPQVKESFAAYQKDLSEEGTLDFLKSGSFDYILCTMLVDVFGSGENIRISPLLRKAANNEKLEEMRNELRMQIQRLLAEGGVLLTDPKTDDVESYVLYHKENGNLVKIPYEKMAAGIMQ